MYNSTYKYWVFGSNQIHNIFFIERAFLALNLTWRQTISSNVNILYLSISHRTVVKIDAKMWQFNKFMWTNFTFRSFTKIVHTMPFDPEKLSIEYAAILYAAIWSRERAVAKRKAA